jgi:hypothetical protein
MLSAPFDLLRCSWPRPIIREGDTWVSEPEWDAPAMPLLPHLRGEIIADELCWLFDWRDTFRQGLKIWDVRAGGTMCDFHVVFRLRMRRGGRLIFWDDDGCLIRRNGDLVHSDRGAHPLVQHEIAVEAGDVLEVAHWQLNWDWQWAARLAEPDQPGGRPHDLLLPYLAQVQERLQHPEGPPLKCYTGGKHPLRAAVAIYSLVLNGYSPSGVYLFGEEQWSPQSRAIFAALLPFAQVVPTEHLLRDITAQAGATLAHLARQHWFVMKMCVGLLAGPDEYCLMDDDVFILERLDEALAAFRDHDLVYTPDQDHGGGYLGTWGRVFGRGGPLPTHRFNAGLYWARRIDDLGRYARQAVAVRPNPHVGHLWEQGFIALAYARRPTLQLPSQRYLMPMFDGLPGGLLGYDYRLNPCGFASIHYGGLFEKPSDGVALQLAPHLLEARPLALQQNALEEQPLRAESVLQA